jgi:hypothetical protein
VTSLLLWDASRNNPYAMSSLSRADVLWADGLLAGASSGHRD